MRCDECGCDTLRQRSVEGHVFLECTLCGTRQGDARALEALEALEWAREHGVDREMLLLIDALKGIKGLHYIDSSGGDAQLGLAPSVYFQLAPASYRYLDKLIRLLEVFTPPSGIKWIVEVSSRAGVSFWLRPLLPVTRRKPTTGEIAGVRADIPDLAELISRNVRLGWWEA